MAFSFFFAFFTRLLIAKNLIKSLGGYIYGTVGDFIDLQPWSNSVDFLLFGRGRICILVAEEACLNIVW